MTLSACSFVFSFGASGGKILIPIAVLVRNAFFVVLLFSVVFWMSSLFFFFFEEICLFFLKSQDFKKFILKPKILNSFCLES